MKDILKMKKCPISGLPIITKPEWKYKAKDGSCTLDIGVIGNNILFEIPVGIVNNEANEWFVKIADKIISEYFGENIFYLAFDYTLLENASLGSKKIFINWLMFHSEKINIISVFGMNQIMKIAINTGKLISGKYNKLVLTDSYESTIKLITESINENKSTINEEAIILSKRCPISGLPIITKSEWNYKAKDGAYSVEISKIGDNIIFIRTNGVSTLEKNEWFMDRVEKIINEYFKTKPCYFIFDYTFWKGTSLKAEKMFLNWVFSIIDKIQLVIVYGISKSVKLTIKTSKMITEKFDKVIILDSYESAIRAILNNKSAKDFKKEIEDSRISELIEYLGKMAWTGDFNQKIPILSEDDPFAELFSAIAVTQDDLRMIDEDRTKIEEELKNNLEEQSKIAKELANNEFVMLNIMEDIQTKEAEAQKAKEETEQSENRFRTLLENANDVIAIIDKDGNIIYGSPSHEKVLGYKIEDTIGKNIMKMVHRDDLEQISNDFKWVMKNPEKSKQINFRLRHKNKKWLYLEGFAKNLLETPNINGIVINYRDITKQKEAEKLLIESEEKYRLIVNNANDGIEISQDGNIIFANPRFAEMLGYELDELKNISFSEIYTGGGIIALYERAKKRAEGNNCSNDYETTFKKKDGDIINVEVRYRVINYKGNEATFAIIHDITERKKVEYELAQHRKHLEELIKERTKELRNTQKKLIRKERLTVLGQIAGSVGHDLRNPLGVISNSIYYLNMKLKNKDEKIEKHFNIIKESIKRSDAIISELLNYSKIKTYDFIETDINEFIKNVVEEMEVPNDVTLEMKLKKTIPKIKLDPEQMRRAFQNIISNAYRSMTEKGKLSIETKSNKEYTEINFIDNGDGIDDENLQKIFEPLFTTRAKGIGLGLSIVKDIIDGHNGKIDVKSKVGQGTTFTVKLSNKKL